VNVRTKQCKACPWRKGVRPEKDIPGGYCVKKHEALSSTIANPGDPMTLAPGGVRMMACHDSPVGAEQPCVGWLINQLNEGNNLGLRMLARDGRFRDVQTDGPQHKRFEDTLPKKRRRK